MKRTICLLMSFAIIATLLFTGCSHEHVFGEWIEIRAANCVNTGEEQRKCEKCDQIETREIEAKGHSFGEWEEINAATCDEDGELKRVCTICSVEEKEVIAHGHDFEKATYFSPKTCKLCGETEGEALAVVLEKGSKIETDNHAFTLKKTYFTTKVSEKHGRTTYNSQEGNYFVIELSFTNLSTEAFDRWNSDRVSDVKFMYANKYEYEGTPYIAKDDIVPLATANLYIMYDVAKGIEKDKEKSMYAIFTIDGETYSILVNEGKSEEDYADSTDIEKNTEGSVVVGDSRTDGENYKFSVEKVYFAKKISEKHGNTTYNSQEGNYLVIKLSFTNLSAVAFDRWYSDRTTDLKLTYDGKFEYEGTTFVAVDDIVPLETANLYIMYEIPDTMKNDTSKPIVAEFTIDGCKYTINCNDEL